MNVALVRIAYLSHPDQFQRPGIYLASLVGFSRTYHPSEQQAVVVEDMNGTPLVPGMVYLAVKKETADTEWQIRGQDVYVTAVELMKYLPVEDTGGGVETFK